MTKQQSRFVIKHPTRGYYTECEIVGTKETIEKDGSGSKSVHDRHTLKPKFGAKANASKFGSETDATAMLSHTHLADTDVFAGCVVEPEFVDGDDE